MAALGWLLSGITTVDLAKLARFDEFAGSIYVVRETPILHAGTLNAGEIGWPVVLLLSGHSRKHIFPKKDSGPRVLSGLLHGIWFAKFVGHTTFGKDRRSNTIGSSSGPCLPMVDRSRGNFGYSAMAYTTCC